MKKEECNEVAATLNFTGNFLGSLSFPVRGQQHDITVALLKKLEQAEAIVRKELTDKTEESHA